jgi:hypothetical protein
MSETNMPSFDLVLGLLRRLDDDSVDADAKTDQFLEVRKQPPGDGVSINGNRAGLVHLARLVLEVAARGFSGAHQHFDEAGELDSCEVPLAITLKFAEWDAASEP